MAFSGQFCCGAQKRGLSPRPCADIGLNRLAESCFSGCAEAFTYGGQCMLHRGTCQGRVGFPGMISDLTAPHPAAHCLSNEIASARRIATLLSDPRDRETVERYIQELTAEAEALSRCRAAMDG